MPCCKLWKRSFVKGCLTSKWQSILFMGALRLFSWDHVPPHDLLFVAFHRIYCDVWYKVCGLRWMQDEISCTPTSWWFQIHGTVKNASNALNTGLVVYICNPSFGRHTQIDLCEFKVWSTVQAPSQPGLQRRLYLNRQTDRPTDQQTVTTTWDAMDWCCLKRKGVIRDAYYVAIVSVRTMVVFHQ